MNDLAQQRIKPATIRKKVEVDVPIERAFDVFASRMGEWWHKGHSIGEGDDPGGRGDRTAPRRALVRKGR